MKKNLMLLLAVLIGSSIISGTIVLATYLEEVEKTEINLEKKRIKQIIHGSVESQARHANIVSNTVSAFYLGSELVTESEFEIFSNNIIHNDPVIDNILVFQNNKIIQSYPFKEFVGKDPHSIGNVITYNTKKYLVFTNEEKDTEISVILFIDPTALVPLQTTLMEPFKVISYVNDEKFFAVENNATESKNSNVFLTTEELRSSINIKTLFDFNNSKNNDFLLGYSIFESEFKNDYENVIWIIVWSGIGTGALISVLFFKNVKNNEQIKGKNKQLEVNSQLLKKTQSLLLESEERYRNLFESSPLANAIIAVDGTINSCNTQTCDLFGYNRDEVIGQHFSKLMTDDDKHRSIKLFEEVLLLGNIRYASVSCRKKNGENFLTTVSASVLKDKNAMAVGIICVIAPREV